MEHSSSLPLMCPSVDTCHGSTPPEGMRFLSDPLFILKLIKRSAGVLLYTLTSDAIPNYPLCVRRADGD